MRQKEPANQRAFTLVEVLIAIAIAAMAFGILLRSATFSMLTVTRSVNRYQTLVLAGALLEQRLGQGVTDQRIESEIGGIVYSLEADTVTSDPRVQQVRVQVYMEDGTRAGLSAYRLRIRRRSP